MLFLSCIGRFEDDFVSQRLRQLQAWVDRMCKHPVIAHSDVFQHFLTCTDDKVTCLLFASQPVFSMLF